MSMKKCLLAVAVLGLTGNAFGAGITTSGTMNVKVAVSDYCYLTAGPTDLDFGTIADTFNLTAQAGAIKYKCTSGTAPTTAYIGIDQGAHGADVSHRKMCRTGATDCSATSDTIGYALYKNHTPGGTNWGNDVATGQPITATITETTVTVYGEITEATPAPGSFKNPGNYLDTVNVSIKTS